MAIGIVKGLFFEDSAPPVGYVWKSASSVSPASVFPGTTWTQLKDRAIIGAGGSYGNGTTGGSSTVTLSTGNLPSHSHSGSTSSAGSHSHDSLTKVKSVKPGSEWNDGLYSKISLYASGSYGISSKSTATSSNGAHSHTASLSKAGSGSSFSVLNPYIVRYMWERIG